MNKLLILLVFCVGVTFVGYSQDSIPKNNEELKALELDEVPIYPGCERKRTEDKRKKCMSDKVSKFITKKYNVDIFDNLNLPSGRYTVTIIFKIDKEGKVIESRARGPHPLLEEEGVRVINSLPKVVPGKVNGKPVVIPYAIPVYLSTAD